MSLLTRAADLLYTFRFLKLLVTPFDKTEAYKLGIIDKNGKRDKDMLIDTPEKKAAYTAFQKLVFNIKKIMAIAPGCGSRIASYAAALYLLKDNYNISDKEMINTFNCGIGFCIIVKKNNIKKIKKYFTKDYKPYEIGYISKGKKRFYLSKNIKW